MYRIMRAIAETILFVTLLIGFVLWLFGPSALGTWIAYPLTSIVLLEAGSTFIEWHKEQTLGRLSAGISFKNMQGDVSALEKMFRHEALLYTSVPLGLIGGTLVGIHRHQTVLATVLFCVQLVLLLASTILLYFLMVSFRRMCDPLFRTGAVSIPQLAPPKRKGWWLKMVEVLVPPPLPKQEDQEQQDLDLACDVSELRKIYKDDALHNTVLLVVFVNVLVSIWGLVVDRRWVLGELLLATLFLSEVPYGIGQYLLHQKVLERFTGSRHAEMAKKLAEYAPVFPPLPTLAALMTTGTIGSLLYSLLDQFLHVALSNLLK